MDEVLAWEADAPLLTHPVMLGALVRLFGITGAIMAGLLVFLFAVQGEWRAIGPMLAMVGAVVGGLFVLSLAVSLVVFGARLRMAFRLDSDGVAASVVDRRARNANRAAAVLGILSGRPALAGAGLLAETESSQSAAWSSIARARFQPRRRTILLSNRWRTVIVLFCTPDNYEAVGQRVRAALAASARPRGRSPLPGLILRTALVVAACAPLFGLPELGDEAVLPALLALCFGLAAVWLIPQMAWVTLGALAWLAGAEILACLQPRQSMFGGPPFRVYEVLSGDDWAILALAGVGAAVLGGLSAALLGGRLRSALAADWAEMAGER
ncbi:MAG TPA: hypothetical protein VG939_01085 [Caulobacteraceae bacterium]|nr:hypothetical protein [Caulobacteraceae bacterium]